MKKCSSQTFLTVQSLWRKLDSYVWSFGVGVWTCFFCLLINVSCYKYCIWQDLQTTSVCNMLTFKKQINVMTMVRRENGWRMIFHYYGCVITLKTCLIVVLQLEVYIKLGSDLSFHSWGSCLFTFQNYCTYKKCRETSYSWCDRIFSREPSVCVLTAVGLALSWILWLSPSPLLCIFLNSSLSLRPPSRPCSAIINSFWHLFSRVVLLKSTDSTFASRDGCLRQSDGGHWRLDLMETNDEELEYYSRGWPGGWERGQEGCQQRVCDV